MPDVVCKFTEQQYTEHNKVFRLCPVSQKGLKGRDQSKHLIPNQSASAIPM